MRPNTSARNIVLLAPAGARIPKGLTNLTCDADLHWKLLCRSQKLRGAIYLEDGAIRHTELINGLHVVPNDQESWHLLIVQDNDQVCGCARFQLHSPDAQFSDLTTASSSLAACSVWGDRVRVEVEKELALSAALGFSFVELGGWALSHEIRGTIESLRMILAVYAFSREIGGAVGLATATVRHSSASILKKMGGRSLSHDGVEVPPYHDDRYGCLMELLRFYSWAPNPRYDTWVEEMRPELSSMRVVSGVVPSLSWMSSAIGTSTSPDREATLV